MKGKSYIDNKLENKQIERQKQIICDCIQHPFDSKKWRIFILEYDVYLRKSLLRLMRASGTYDPNLLNDLVQEVYQLLLLNRCQALRNFKFRHANSFKGYLLKIAIRVFGKYLKGNNLEDLGVIILPLFSDNHYNEEMEQSQGFEFIIPDSRLKLDQEVLRSRYNILEDEMRRFVISRNLDRDLRIFRLYVLERFTSAEIANDLPFLGLKASSIDTIVVRIRDQIRSHYTQTELWELLLLV